MKGSELVDIYFPIALQIVSARCLQELEAGGWDWSDLVKDASDVMEVIIRERNEILKSKT